MRLSLRFIVPLLLVLGGLTYAVLPLVDNLMIRWFERDLEIRANLVANTVQESLHDADDVGDRARLRQVLTRLTQDERVFAVGFCPESGPAVVVGPLPSDVRCTDLTPGEAANFRVATATGSLLVSTRALISGEAQYGGLILAHDMTFATRRSEETRRYVFYLFLGIAATVSLLTVIIAQVSWRGWENGMRALLRGEGLLRPVEQPDVPEFRPIIHDLRALIRDVAAERHPRDEERFDWSPEALRAVLHDELRGQEVIVVSNREPYLHVRTPEGVQVRRPASGMVTALEPVMRTCSGVWIAHGSGSGDRDVVDGRDSIAVPPGQPSYRLRRVWMNEEEERGYYYGLANEGLWPLCHIAHVRPTFRTADWRHYVTINQRFADAVVAEAKTADPLVLVQDFHLALVPRMLRGLLPAATIVTFWHIPWPNPEAFAICPWREEILDGLLGSSILGFHTQFHCNNFVDTVDRQLEARVDRETFSVSYRGGLTAVKRYPVSIEWPPDPQLIAKPIEDCRRDVRRRHGLPADHMVGIGIDRFDYTKGIEERCRAVEQFFVTNPTWLGRFTFIQIAAPTRSGIEEYDRYRARVTALVERINKRFSDAAFPPILLLASHHEPDAVYQYYRAADVCLVTSLHDGMNLVAKEFIASRDDERGVLILSQFTGAVRELPEAIVVNPYDADECASAILAALEMAPREQQARLRLMRSLVREFSVFRWAGRLLIDAAGMRNRRRLLDRLVPREWTSRGDASRA